jgi:hypothetical protein
MVHCYRKVTGSIPVEGSSFFVNHGTMILPFSVSRWCLMAILIATALFPTTWRKKKRSSSSPMMLHIAFKILQVT